MNGKKVIFNPDKFMSNDGVYMSKFTVLEATSDNDFDVVIRESWNHQYIAVAFKKDFCGIQHTKTHGVHNCYTVTRVVKL